MSEFYGSVDEVESVLLPVFYQEAKEENLDNNVSMRMAPMILHRLTA